MASPMENIGKTRSGAAARGGENEYGGRSGHPQRGSLDGSVEHELTAQEKAGIVRTYGIRTPSGAVRLDGLPWAEGVAREAEAQERVNGRTVEEGLA